MVTGAGSSIGSELCRQILDHGAARLILLDHSEYALYSIDKELKQRRASANPAIEIVPVIGSVLNQALVARLLAAHAPDSVFHAAAYKHVPLLEENEAAGVENNLLGTICLADACLAARVPRMTMVSTDKAVRPTNVMGASKRLAELYIQALARQPGTGTIFGIVRFGNVLDSSGSVVQEFRHQIEAGGPLTVTDAEITRFFMSIPEATQLVLQANSLARGGEVFVLDMGEPVRIVDLARTMIALAGLTEKSPANPNGDIVIDIVGLRPGEKLHEELFVGERVAETLHPQIKMAHERFVALGELMPALAALRRALTDHDRAAVRRILTEVLSEEQRPVKAPAAAAQPAVA